jgi:hypothetical protein
LTGIVSVIFGRENAVNDGNWIFEQALEGRPVELGKKRRPEQVKVWPKAALT